jgi:hypothetical protein
MLEDMPVTQRNNAAANRVICLVRRAPLFLGRANPDPAAGLCLEFCPVRLPAVPDVIREGKVAPTGR